LQVRLRRANVFLLLETITAISLVMMVTLSWYKLSGDHAAGDQLLPAKLTTSLLIGSLVPALMLVVLFGRRVALARASARSVLGSNGRLHVRLVWLFSLIAAVPTLLVVVFASLLFQSGVEFWFSDNSRGMLENANSLAKGYYADKLRDVGKESVAMAGDLRSYLGQAPITSQDFQEGYSWQIISRKLDESAIVERGEDGNLRTAAIVDPRNDTRQRITGSELQRMEQGEPVVVNASAEKIEAVTPIDRARGLYLYVARNSDQLAYSQSKRAESVLAAYDMLTRRARALQVRFNLALFGISLALVMLAVWAALRLADRQVAPLVELVVAARKVGSGNFAMRVAHGKSADEVGMLARAFNRMTAQLETQTRALVSANALLDVRRTFIEAVIESITAGIISVDREGTIRLINSSAQKLLGEDSSSDSTGASLETVAPQLFQLVTSGEASGVVHYAKSGDLLTLAVKVTRAADGYVVTFEDITRQLVDQRRAAWSDVARRIAHEIKNPLTPIQLATERLKRRYLRQITTDPELFEELTATIIRQVGDLRKMVDEFSSFARLPKPVFRAEDAGELARQAIFLQEVAHSSIAFFYSGSTNEPFEADRHQFSQVMTNVLKNAVEAIEARMRSEDVDYRGRIAVSLDSDDQSITISVVDNGVGLPAERERILEPYVTTREKGTGLGLAIVNKIVEEHGGEMAFSPVEGGGARVTMRFARSPSTAGIDPAEIVRLAAQPAFVPTASTTEPIAGKTQIREKTR
jgi:two-component system nitrogen regulation sensor histidine kinase NtrY